MFRPPFDTMDADRGPVAAPARAQRLAAGLVFAAAATLGAHAPAARAQAPEFRINVAVADSQNTTLGALRARSVTRNGSGVSVVVWQSALQDGGGTGIYCRRYGPTGVPLGNEFLVNTTVTGDQVLPAVAIDNGGNFIVVWCGTGSGDGDGVFARLYDSAGTPRTGEFLINQTTAGTQHDPDVAMEIDGDFVVVWQGAGPGDADGIFRRPYDSTGAPAAAETRVNSSVTGAQSRPAICTDANRGIIIAWESRPTLDADIWFQRYNAGGNPQGNAVRANTTTAGDQQDAAIAVASNGDFAVVWESLPVAPGTDDPDLYLQRFSSSGNPSGTETAVTADTDGEQRDPAIDLDISGHFVVAWASDDDSTAAVDWNVRVQQFDKDGVRIGVGLVANATVSGDQSSPSIALDDVDNYTVIWAGSGPGDAHGVFGSLGQEQDVVGALRASAEPQFSRTLLPGAPLESVFRLQLVNETAAAETLQAVTFTNTAAGLGTPAQLDADWAGATLETETPPTPLATSFFSGGRLAFPNLNIVVLPTDSLTLVVRGGASLSARDGDVLDLRIEAEADLVLRGSTVLTATWPLDPAGSFQVDGMTAAQLVIRDVGGNLYAGSTRNLALDMTVPANGYQLDRLEKLNVFNFGTAVESLDITRAEAWVDDGDGSFETTADRLLGALVFTGNRWEITGLSEAVGLAGLRLFVTVDTSPTARLGRTLRLGITNDTDVAVGMQSGNDGPTDRAAANRLEQSISVENRVTLNAAAHAPGRVPPGARGVPILQLSATNSYATPKQLTGLALANATTSPNGGTVAERDAEFQLLTLRADGDDDGVLDDTAVDPILATSYFANGRGSFDGFTWDLPVASVRHLFVTADVSLGEAADGDVLGTRVENAFDVSFADATSVTASWPLDSGARATVDGMVASQVTNLGARGTTLGPNEGPALALDVLVPANGYADDMLESLTLVNLGTASSADIADLRLWRDGGDGLFTPGTGDDTAVGALVQVGSSWKSTVLNEPLTGPGARLFVGVRPSNAPRDSSTLRLCVPIGGIQTASANDGPVDGAICNAEALVFSTAPLLATLSIPFAQSTVAQDFEVRMEVRNVSAEMITGIVPSALVAAGDAGVTLVAGPAPSSMDLAPDAASVFTWTFRGTTSGSLQFSGSASGTGAGGILRRSLHVQAPAHSILLPAGSLVVQPVGSVPFSVNRGETDIVPLSLTLTNSSGPTSADIVVSALRLRLEDEQGNGIVPADILSRIALAEGTITYASTTSLPTSGDEITLVVASPLTITPTEPATVSIRCDMLSSTVVTAFRLAVVQADWVTAADGTLGTPVGVQLQQGSFPILSGTGRVRAAPTELDVQGLPGTAARAGRGQGDVALLRLQLQNPGVADLTSHVRVGQLAVALTDAGGVPQPNPARFLRSIRLASGAVTLDQRVLNSGPDTTLVLDLPLPALVAAGTNTELLLLGEITNDCPLGSLRVRLEDPAHVEARDENTNAPVPVVYATTPIVGDPVVIEAVADRVLVAGTPAFPPSFSVGETGRTALTATLRHPGVPGTGRIRIQSFAIACGDEARRPLAPDRYIDALRVMVGAQEIGSAGVIPASGNIDVPTPNFVLDPGESATVSVIVDIESTAPATSLELLLQSILATDANVGLPVQVVPEANTELPLTSGLARLAAPATELVVSLESAMPAALVADGSLVPLGQLEFRNSASAGAGDIRIDHLVVRGSDSQDQALAIGRVAEQILVRLGDQTWAMSDSLTPDSVTVTLRPAQPLVAEPDSPVQLDVFAVLRTDAGVKAFRAGVVAADIGVVQPSSALLRVRVVAEPGSDFPLWTKAGSFGTTSLRESFANFPNPFGAGREPTMFVYYLPAPGTVSLRILTLRGDTVAWLLRNTNRAAGLQQQDLWTGQNGRGLVVVNGVYLAELSVELADGTRERLLRKVAVVR